MELEVPFVEEADHPYGKGRTDNSEQVEANVREVGRPVFPREIIRARVEAQGKE
jgi:hypothetical protein